MNRLSTLNKSLKREKRQTEQAGLFIVVHRRSESDKRQQAIKSNDIFKILQVSQTKTGIKTLRCKRYNSDEEFQINESVFTWDIFTEKAVEMVRQEICYAYMRELKDRKVARQKEEDARAVQEMQIKFTAREQMQISFAHLVLAELAWQYADSCIVYCKRNRLKDVKKLTEKFENMRDDYDGKFLKQSLDERWRRNIKRDAKQISESKAFQNESKWAFDVICDAYDKQYPDSDIEYKLLRVIAQLGRFMVEVYNRQIDRVNQMIDERIGGNRQKSAKNIIISEALVDFFDCMQGDYTLESTPEFERIISRISRFVEEADFCIKGKSL